MLVSDLFEGGNPAVLRSRVAELVRDGVNVLVLLALSDDGAPAHDHHEAEALAALGATVTACTPDEFPEHLRCLRCERAQVTVASHEIERKGGASPLDP